MYRLKKFCDENHIAMEYEVTFRNSLGWSYRFRFQRGDLALTRQVDLAEIAGKYMDFELDMIERLKRDFQLEVADTTRSCMTCKYASGESMCKYCAGANFNPSCWELNTDVVEALNRIYGREHMNYYIDTDIASTYAAYNNMYKKKTQRQKALDKIQNVIFNDPATIVIWADGTKTVVKAENEPYDPEKGLAMAIAKKFFDNKGYYFDIFKKWLPVEDEEEKLVVAINPKTKSTAIPLREYCDQENITKNKAMGQIRRGEILAFKNEKGLWMVVRD